MNLILWCAGVVVLAFITTLSFFMMVDSWQNNNKNNDNDGIQQ